MADPMAWALKTDLPFLSQTTLRQKKRLPNNPPPKKGAARSTSTSGYIFYHQGGGLHRAAFAPMRLIMLDDLFNPPNGFASGVHAQRQADC